MHFTKMHGAGNDFVIIENLNGELDEKELPALAVRLCAYHTGVGADGLMVIVPAREGGDFKMLFYNRDGSRGEMCGNGARCICRYGHDRGFSGDIQTVEADAGKVIGRRISETEYRIRLNDPSVIDLKRSALGYECAYVELGCPGIPHAVVLKNDWDKMPRGELFSLGRELRYAKEFPKGANVSFVKKLGENAYKAVTYERGVEDFTLACGTGSGSAVTVFALKGYTGSEKVKLTVPGGELFVSVMPEGQWAKDLFLTGPTNIVAKGEVTDEDLLF